MKGRIETGDLGQIGIVSGYRSDHFQLSREMKRRERNAPAQRKDQLRCYLLRTHVIGTTMKNAVTNCGEPPETMFAQRLRHRCDGRLERPRLNGSIDQGFAFRAPQPESSCGQADTFRCSFGNTQLVSALHVI